MWAGTKDAWDANEALGSGGSFFTNAGYFKNKGYTLTITYSDGGTEKYIYVIGAPSDRFVERIENTLNPGTGVSKCPV